MRYTGNGYVFYADKSDYSAADIRESPERLQMRYACRNDVSFSVCRKHVVESVLLGGNTAEPRDRSPLHCHDIVDLETYLFVNSAEDGDIFNAPVADAYRRFFSRNDPLDLAEIDDQIMFIIAHDGFRFKYSVRRSRFFQQRQGRLLLDRAGSFRFVVDTVHWCLTSFVITQKYAKKVSDFVREGFKPTTVSTSTND